MKNTKKKGFTIVELVIVIAVIGILSAILIPTFVGLIKKANISADVMTVRNINMQLKMDESTNGKPQSFNQMLKVAGDAGYDIEKLSPTTEGYSIVWDKEQNTLFLFDEKGNLAPNQQGEPGLESNLWAIATTASEVTASKYNSYLKSSDIDAIETARGIEVSGSTNVTFKTEENGDYQVIMNGGDLTIDAPNASVSSFGEKNSVNIERTAMSSYHEFGKVNTKIDLKEGRVVVEKNAEVEIVNVTASESGKFSIDTTQNSSVALVSADNPEVLNDTNVKTSSTTGVIDSQSQDSEVYSNVLGFTSLEEAFASEQDMEIILLQDINISKEQFKTRYNLNKGNTILFNLNQKEFNVANSNKYSIINVANDTICKIINGTMNLKNAGGSECLIAVGTSSKLTLDRITLVADSTALYIEGASATIEVMNSSVTSDSFAIGTNANKADHYNVVINLLDSTFVSEGSATILFNIPGTLNIDNCHIKCVTHGVIVRGGEATIKNSTIEQDYNQSDAEQVYSMFDNGWRDGNYLTVGGLIIGNHSNGYQYSAKVTLENTTIKSGKVGETEKYFPAIYMYGNTGDGIEAFLTMSDDVNLQGGELVIGNDHCYINGTKQTPTAN